MLLIAAHVVMDGIHRECDGDKETRLADRGEPQIHADAHRDVMTEPVIRGGSDL